MEKPHNAITSFVGVLFVDALQRTLRVTADAENAKSTGSGDVRTETSVAARKF